MANVFHIFRHHLIYIPSIMSLSPIFIHGYIGKYIKLLNAPNHTTPELTPTGETKDPMDLYFIFQWRGSHAQHLLPQTIYSNRYTLS